MLRITPWNFPLAMATRKIGPAIAAGCTMILKPAPDAARDARARPLLSDAGLPPGVLDVLTTSRASSVSRPLMADARIRKLSFTGSTEVGRRLIELSAEAGADVDGAGRQRAVHRVRGRRPRRRGRRRLLAKMRNIGEACTAANRFLAPIASREFQ